MLRKVSIPSERESTCRLVEDGTAGAPIIVSIPSERESTCRL